MIDALGSNGARGVAPRKPFLPRLRIGLGVAAVCALLAGCNPITGPGASGARDLKLGGLQNQPAPPANGDSIGEGAIKIGLIVPLTQASGGSVVGAALRNAAQLAYIESGVNDVTIVVKDDGSTPAGAAQAAQAAIGDGAEILIGPVFAAGVKEAGRVARAAGKPIIAFSTDTSAAAKGVYLLSFLVENDVERIIDFAAQKGRKSIAALIPENEYGTIALAQFQQSAANHGLRVVAAERYSGASVGDAVRRVGAARDQIDSLFIAEQAESMGAVAKELTSAGIDGKKLQILGTGLWNDARVIKLPAMQGAWFAAPENAGFNAFAQRYRAKFNADPPRKATLAYDAVTLAIALSHSQGSQRYSESVLTNPSGFNGADGLFRFKPDGTNERGLSVLEIGGGSAKIVSPAPRTFTGNGA